MTWDNEVNLGEGGSEGRIRCMSGSDRIQFD
jgi:hypothetical protein